MAKFDWLSDVIKVLRSTPPPMPGETDQAYAVLEKTLNYAYSKCWNDKEVGTDGCAVCRAYRTEKAEASAADKGAKLEAAQTNLATVNADNAKFSAQVNDLINAVQDLEGQRRDAIAGLEVANANCETALQDRDDALKERWQAQADYKDCYKQLQDAEELADSRGIELDHIKTILKDLI